MTQDEMRAEIAKQLRIWEDRVNNAIKVDVNEYYEAKEEQQFWREYARRSGNKELIDEVEWKMACERRGIQTAQMPVEDEDE